MLSNESSFDALREGARKRQRLVPQNDVAMAGDVAPYKDIFTPSTSGEATPYKDTFMPSEPHRGMRSPVNGPRLASPNAGSRRSITPPQCSNAMVVDVTAEEQEEAFHILRSAIIAGDMATFQATVRSGCTLDGVDPLYGKTLVHVAVEKNQLDMLEILLRGNAPKDHRDRRYQRTPLHAAVHMDNVEAARLLLQAGASTTILDCHGYTPLQSAVNDEHPEMVELLRAHGADGSRTTKAINLRALGRGGRIRYESVPSANELAELLAAATISHDEDEISF